MLAEKPSGWAFFFALIAIILVHEAGALFCQTLESLDDGTYRIFYNGPGSCKGRPLTYPKYGKAYPGLAKISPESARNAALWQLSNAGNGQITLEAMQRAQCCPAKLGYQSPCKSTSVRLAKKGVLRWVLKPAKGSNNYLIVAGGKKRCTSGLPTLGPVDPSKCDTSNKVGLLPQNVKNIGWRFEKVSDTPSPPPPPPPPPAIEVPKVISEFVVQTNDTCTSLSSEQIQRIPNGLCDTQVEYVVSQGWPSNKVQCNGLASCNPIKRKTLMDVVRVFLGKRRLLQNPAGTVYAVTNMTFPGTTPVEVTTVNNIAENTSKQIQEPTFFANSIPDGQVTSSGSQIVQEETPVPSPSPSPSTSPSPSPSPSTSPSPSPSPSPLPSPLPVPAPITPSCPPGQILTVNTGPGGGTVCA